MVERWLARRAHNKDGIRATYDELIGRLDLSRHVDDTDTADFYAMLEARRSTERTFCFAVQAEQGFSTKDQAFHLTLFVVPLDYQFDNIFSIAIKHEKYRFKFNPNQEWRKICIIAPEIEDHQKIIFRFECAYAAQAAADDTLSIQQLEWIADTDFVSLVQQGYDEVLSAGARFIASHRPQAHNQKSLLISCAPINIQRYRYNTADFFYGQITDRLMLNDVYQTWYNADISGFSHDFISTIANINAIAKDRNIKHRVIFGASMGGYGALVYGFYAKCDEILAFNPELELFIQGSRSQDFFKQKTRLDAGLTSVGHLLPLIGGRVRLHYSLHDPIDAYFYQKSTDILKAKTNATAIGLPLQHEIGEFLKQADFLLLLIRDALQKDQTGMDGL